MKIKLFSMLIAFVVVSNIYAQSDLNNYKYVIVPNKFDFLAEKDQYRLNSLAAFLFKKYGFIALREGEAYPSDLSNNRCLALRSDVIKDSGLFKTKLKVELKDCDDRVIYTSQVGQSREKEFKKSYVEALRNAFKSFETVDYKYVPKENDAVVATGAETKDQSEVTQEIQKLKQEIQTLKKEKEANTQAEVSTKMEEPVKEATTIVEKETPKKAEKVISSETASIKKASTSSILYAQEISNGFQLVDSTPKVVYKIIKTGANNVFLVESLSAIIYKEGNNWILEHYTGNTLMKEKLNIKF